jgi:hypothetical protein
LAVAAAVDTSLVAAVVPVGYYRVLHTLLPELMILLLGQAMLEKPLDSKVLVEVVLLQSILLLQLEHLLTAKIRP